jgi:hypothetical protein
VLKNRVEFQNCSQQLTTKGWFTRPRPQSPAKARVLEPTWLICAADCALAQYLAAHQVSRTDGLNNLILLGATFDGLLLTGDVLHRAHGSNQVNQVQAQTTDGRPLHPRRK